MRAPDVEPDGAEAAPQVLVPACVLHGAGDPSCRAGEGTLPVRPLRQVVLWEARPRATCD